MKIVIDMNLSPDWVKVDEGKSRVRILPFT